MSSNDLESLGCLLADDRAHLWHPYASALAPQQPYLVESARGVRLRVRLPDGRLRECVDAMSSWWCAIHGYAVPELDRAAAEQLARMSHVMFGGLTHEPAIRLARRLVELAPGGPSGGGPQVDVGRPRLDRVFFADSGSVSVEVAMKLALQAQLGAGRSGRTRFFTIRGGYHGDTFSPMSVTDPEGGMHALWRGILPEHVFAPHPPPLRADGASEPGALAAWEQATTARYAAHADRIAAVILEPVVQGAGGMTFHDPQVVRVLARLARSSGALLILDEIATGFGRTGTLWGADRAGVVPDVMCVGKALTGGYLSLAAVLCSTPVAEAVSAEAAGGALMHGPTFMANPLACAIAGASIDLLLSNGVAGAIERVADLQAGLQAGLEPARVLSSVADVRVLGGIGVIQLREPARGLQLAAYAIEQGVWVRPFRDLVYTMPPYVTDPDDLALVCRALLGAVAQVHG